jgi:putative redox protein
MEAVVFQNAKKQNLVGVMHHGHGNEPSPCLVVCHGFAGTKIGGSRRFVEFARYAVKHNLSVFRFDFAGSGDSDGDLADLTLDSELDDLQAAVNVVSTMDGVDPERIGTVGHCLGAVTAIRASARDSRIYKSVAWAPFTDLANTMVRLIGEEAFCVLQEGDEADFLYNEQLFRCGPKILNQSSNLDMFEEIIRVRQPLLVIHGTEDATVPLPHVEKLMDFAQGTPGEKKLSVLEGAHHSFPYHQEELFELTVEWFLSANNK